MKVDFLKNLGITDQTVIDSIMAENGKDIEKVKGNLETYKTQIENLNNQITDRDKQLKELKDSTVDNEKLQSKIAELESVNKSSKEQYEATIKKLQKDNEIESKLRDAKAKNIKAVRALINEEDDLDKQIKKLQENEDTGFLFESQNTVKVPSGTTPSSGIENTQIKTDLTFADRISNALKVKG